MVRLAKGKGKRMQPSMMPGSKRSQRSRMSGHGERAARRPERVLAKPMEAGKLFEDDPSPFRRRLVHKANRRFIQEQLALMSVEFTEFLFGDGDFTPVWGNEESSTRSEKGRRSAEEHRALCKKDRRSYYRRATHCVAVTVTANGAFFQKAI